MADRYTLEELSAMMERELSLAIGAPDSTIAQERQRNLQFYNAEPVGELAPPEDPDSSRIVATDVADTVEWMLPSLVRIFSTSKDSMACRPKRPKYAPQAKLAEEYLRHKFWKQNKGFSIVYDLFKDALLQRVGFVKVYWDDEPEDVVESYRGLLPEQVADMLSDGQVEVIEQAARIEMIEAPEMPGMPEQAEKMPVEVYDVKVKVRTSPGKCRVVNVPPEEMRIHRRARYGEEPLFLAQVQYRTRAELEAEGYDLSDVGSGEDWGLETLERSQIQSPFWEAGDEGERQLFRFAECYTQLDQDNDKVPEWRRIVVIGSKAMSDEQVDSHPFVWFCPNPIPHLFFGKCPADFAIEPQRLNTSLLRALSDNVYLTVHQQYAVVSGKVNLDDLTSRRPGGVVRMTEQGAVQPLSQSGLDPAAWQMIEWGEQWRERRTGFTRYSQGMSPDALNPTATGVNLITEKADQRTELIASVAAISIEQIFRKMLKCMSQYQSIPEQMEISGQWVPIDPREWADGYDIEINVGLGTGSKDKKAQTLQAIFGMQQPMLQGGAIPPQAVIATARAFVDATGAGVPEELFPDPQPPAPGAPPPQVQIEQMKLQADAQKFQAQSQMDAARMQMEAQLQQQNKQAELEVQRMNDERDAQREQVRIQMEAEAKAQEAAIRAELDRARLELDRYKADLDAQVKLAIAQMSKAPDVSADSSAMTQTLADISRAAFAAMTAPKQVVRGPDGRVAGVVAVPPQEGQA